MKAISEKVLGEKIIIIMQFQFAYFYKHLSFGVKRALRLKKDQLGFAKRFHEGLMLQVVN